jgi:glycosyltransferase involved in cell wall biosynthesis
MKSRNFFLRRIFRRIRILIFLFIPEFAKLPKAYFNSTIPLITNEDPVIYFLYPENLKNSAIFANTLSLLSNTNKSKILFVEEIFQKKTINATHVVFPIGSELEYLKCFKLNFLYSFNFRVIFLIHDLTTFEDFCFLLRYTTKLGIFRRSQGLIQRSYLLVHSNFAKNRLELHVPPEHIAIIKQGVPFLNNYKFGKRTSHGYAIGTGGYWNKARDLKSTINIFALLAKMRPDCNFYVSGFLNPNQITQVLKVWQSYHLPSSQLVLLGYLEGVDFVKYLESLSLFVYLRKSTSGESSGLAIECAAAGTPFIFKNLAALDELPSEIFDGVPVGISDEEFASFAWEIVSDQHNWHKKSLELQRFAESRSAREYANSITKQILDWNWVE